MVPKKTIYVREEDGEIFEQAEDLSEEESLSQTIVRALERLIERGEANEEGFKEFTLEVGIKPPGRSTSRSKKISFYGRKLATTVFICDDAEADDEDQDTEWTLYQGRKGRFLVYKRPHPLWKDESNQARYKIYDTLDEVAEGEDLPEDFLQTAKERMTQPGVKKLDI